MDHFFLLRVKYFGIADRHSGMLSVHSTRHKGANEVIRIFNVFSKIDFASRGLFLFKTLIFENAKKLLYISQVLEVMWAKLDFVTALLSPPYTS